MSQYIVDYMVQLSFPKELDLRHYSFDKLQQDIYKIRLTFTISYFNIILKKNNLTLQQDKRQNRWQATVYCLSRKYQDLDLWRKLI